MKLDEKEKSSTVWEQLGVFKDARDEDPVSVVGTSVHPGSRNIQVVRDEDIPAVTIAT